MNYAKRLYFFPFLHYAAQNPGTAHTFQRKEIPSISRETRRLRKYLTVAAENIEKAMKAGGASVSQSCVGISNPWKPYVFQIAGPISRRLDILLGAKKRNNASLIFFTLSVVTVLDFFLNNSESWAYNQPRDEPFRSVNGEGVTPQFGVDEKVDADAIFKRASRDREEAAEAAKKKAAGGGA
jgi:hypothetical protein